MGGSSLFIFNTSPTGPNFRGVKLLERLRESRDFRTITRCKEKKWFLRRPVGIASEAL